MSKGTLSTAKEGRGEAGSVSREKSWNLFGKRSTSIDVGKQHLFETNHMWPEESIEGESGQGWEAGRRHWASQSPPSWES